jgi:putative hemolysin
MIFDLVAILILFLVNGLLSMAEIAIVTARRARLSGMVEKGNKGAEIAIALNREPGRLLSALQSGMTLIGILTGAIGGVAVTEPLAAKLGRNPMLAPYAGDIAFVAVVVVTSYVSLIIGELVPKQIGLRFPEPIAAVAAPIMLVWTRINAPMIWLLDVSTRSVLRLFGVREYNAQTVTEDEVKTLVAEGAETGVFHPAEREMVTRVLRFADRTARSIMTPRGDVVWFSDSDTTEIIDSKIAAAGHSRYPLGAAGPEGFDHIRGIVHLQDLLLQSREGRAYDLSSILRPVPVVHDGMPVLELLETLREHATRLALVVDEYGVIEGIVTMTDILEAVVGALPDTHGGDGDVPVEAVSEGSWIMEGSVPVEDVKMHLRLQELPGEEDVTTLGGFVMTELGRVPESGDAIEYGGYRFEVVDMDGRRVDKVSVTKLREERTEDL